MTQTQAPRTHNPTSTSAQGGPAASGSTSVFTNILCAVDGTRTSTAAVKLAASLAGPDDHLTLLAVTAVSGSGAYATAAISPGRFDLLLGNAKRVTDRAGVRSTTVVDPGSPRPIILQRAASHDLLAIGAPANSRVSIPRRRRQCSKTYSSE